MKAAGASQGNKLAYMLQLFGHVFKSRNAHHQFSAAHSRIGIGFGNDFIKSKVFAQLVNDDFVFHHFGVAVSLFFAAAQLLIAHIKLAAAMHKAQLIANDGFQFTRGHAAHLAHPKCGRHKAGSDAAWGVVAAFEKRCVFVRRALIQQCGHAINAVMVVRVFNEYRHHVNELTRYRKQGPKVQLVAACKCFVVLVAQALKLQSQSAGVFDDVAIAGRNIKRQ